MPTAIDERPLAPVLPRGTRRPVAGSLRRAVAASATVAALLAVSAVARPAERVVVPWSDGVPPVELFSPAPDTVVLLRARSARPADPAGTAARQERARQEAASIAFASEERPAEAAMTIVVPYAGGPLPPEAAAPPHDVVVELLHVPEVALRATLEPPVEVGDETVEASDTLELGYAGGSLPPELLSPPEGTVVLLRAPDAVADAAAVLDAIRELEDPETAAEPEVLASGTRGAPPPEYFDPPPDTRVLLLAPRPPAAAAGAPATAAAETPAGPALQGVVATAADLRRRPWLLSPSSGQGVRLLAPRR